MKPSHSLKFCVAFVAVIGGTLAQAGGITSLQRLENEREVRDAIIVMQHAIDAGDWEQVLRSLASDFRFESAGNTIRGNDEMVNALKTLSSKDPAMRLQHIFTDMLVTVSAEEADVSANEVVYSYIAGKNAAPVATLGSRNQFHLRRVYGSWIIVTAQNFPYWRDAPTAAPR